MNYSITNIRLNTSLLAFVLFTFLFIGNSNAQTYVTLTGGAWTDNVSVWSTNGGASACGCNPGTAPGAVTIIVDHALTVAPNIDLTNSNFTLNATGSLNGAFTLTAGTSTIDIHGIATIGDYIQNAGAITTVHSGGTIIAPGGLTLNGGTLTLDAAQTTSGGTRIFSGAILNILNGSKFNMTTGNLRNEGTINMDPGTCIETNGNISNRPTGVINGNGVLNSGGNINNQGFIANTIAWCATGSGVGLLTAEDCATATGVCGAIVLPIELTDFSAEVNESNEAVISWRTISEFNNSYFELSKSADGINWTEVATVDGAGTTDEEQYYEITDEASTGVTYYMLTQYDYDGRENTFGPVSITNKASMNAWTVSPNPSTSFSKLTIRDLSIGEGELIITDMRGFEIERMPFNSSNGELEYQLSQMEGGVYLMTIQMDGLSKTERILVRD